MAVLKEKRKPKSWGGVKNTKEELLEKKNKDDTVLLLQQGGRRNYSINWEKPKETREQIS